VINYHQDSIDNQIFHSIITAGDKIWFIPLQTNEILYVEKGTMKINAYPVDNEQQSEESLQNQFWKYKYMLDYVRNDRYIGLFSLKNGWITR
jgi:hypothetical protein